jgi:LmbE family N-acetylglucosaminyl deacetylase
MKALCLVAHPDDCVIFAYSYIYHHSNYDWTIGYLTYTEQDPRGAEFKKFWNKRNIDTVFLGFEDHWHDNEQKQLTRWSGLDATAACQLLAEQYELVLTHDEHGDYGHIHHKVVHDAVIHHHSVVTFARPGQGTTYILPKDAYNLDELPLHRDIVAGFHSTIHQNSYKENQ